MTLLWGTYPAAGLGTPAGLGEGLWIQDDAGLAGAVQVAELPAPSYVLAHPELPLVYVASELPDSALTVLDVSRPPAPRIVASVPTGGADACHLLLAPDARTLYVSHYSSGDVAVVRLSGDGLPADAAPAQLLGHAGSGPNADRQQGPHAHSSLIAPGGAHLLVCDLGTDELRRYRIGSDGLLEPDGIAATLPPGAGPRHAVVRGGLIYVTCELDHLVRTLRWDPTSATAEVIAEAPSTLAPPRSAELQDSHLALADGPHGEVLLVSVRGADVVSVFDIAPEGELTYRAAIDAGEWPRFFAVLGDRLIVGAERGHEVRAFAMTDVFALRPESGIGDVIDLPHAAAEVVSPACVAAV
ncbi:beta-propeller fold lactonase family protein [Demequina sp. SYSU T00039]|uniref:Beta-propeller fold lactonase family protein n=1 Tax=Demequina lignilytica TaxID=3051663 RepID=A0AAW7M335_9MICO|nr:MULTISPECIES: beta-propeller fold lactonase family protein [unclassified Demequina]MDN4477480.1 beta-propeller fold lactonase family protein [Demequina sp. SYSU T00039-1]MDN4488169.1 beta-propeller fold lactonase family protein [Demequina sp. SYSU T00039]MDN4490610.1 beta-propeller fold lactonase family protein [Demequina sp. SYSU T00068]